MKNKKDIAVLHEQKIITTCILKGMTLKQIANILHCAKSTAGYKTKKLYKEYNASDRYEFVINIFTKLILEYKNKLEKMSSELKQYKNSY